MEDNQRIKQSYTPAPPCGNAACPSNDRSESGCAKFPRHTVDLCPTYEKPSEIERLTAQNIMLRRMNRNLVATGKDLARENRMLRGGRATNLSLMEGAGI